MSHIFAHCASQTNTRPCENGSVLFESRHVQEYVTQIIYLGPLPTARRLQPGQMLRLPAPGPGVSTRRRRELARAWVEPNGWRQLPAPAAGACLAPAHIPVQPARSYTPTALMRVVTSPAPMIPMQQSVQRHLRP